jgi:hypothetical protein
MGLGRGRVHDEGNEAQKRVALAVVSCHGRLRSDDYLDRQRYPQSREPEK